MKELKDLYRLKKKDIIRASDVLAKAFIDDPDLVKVIRDDERRLEKMGILFRPFVRFGILYGEVYSPTEDIEGVAVWNPSATKNITFIRSLRSGFMEVMSKITKEERSRFTTYGREMDRYTRNMIDGKHWFLFIIGIDPKHQRKGYGTMLLEPMLERMDSEELPVMLDTNKEDNIGYYGRFGFRIKERYRVLDNRHWGLVRPPSDQT